MRHSSIVATPHHGNVAIGHKILPVREGFTRAVASIAACPTCVQIETGGHHQGTEQTMRNAFYHARLFDYNSAEQWEAKSKKDAVARAHEKYKTMIKAYEQPALDPAVNAALTEFIAKRKSGCGCSYGEERKQPQSDDN
ncbi:MAG: trimethylamine methyltransferase family protein [Chloroflexota bacterium]